MNANQKQRQRLLNFLKPYIIDWINRSAAGTGPFAPTPHGLSSSHHSGQLADSQAPQFLKTDGSRPLTGNLSVDSGVTIDGVNISELGGASYLLLSGAGNLPNHRAFTAGDGLAGSDGGPADNYQLAIDLDAPAGLVFNAGKLAVADNIAGDGLAIAAKILSVDLDAPAGLVFNAGKLAVDDNIAGNGLTIAAKVLNVGAGNGLSVDNDAVHLQEPGTLHVGSANNAAGSHTHTITSSSNPGANAVILAANANGHLQLVRLGLGVSPANSALQVRGSGQQVRLEHDASNFTDLFTNNGGSLNIKPTGNVIFDPTGKDLLPQTDYDLNIGAINKKFKTLHAAELWVETLVAQETLATIGGRILVGPTTTLVTNVTSTDERIYVKHNQMSDSDIVYLEADGNIEFMRIDGEASHTPYEFQYRVVRNLDGTGANEWPAGSAVFNTGQSGDGFIDLYSLKGVSSGAGPTIALNKRNSITFNDWSTHAAIGNLNALYGYSTDIFGVAVGRYASDSAWLSADPANGVRIMRGDVQKARWFTNGDILIGREVIGESNLLLSAGEVLIRNNNIPIITLRSATAADGTIASFDGAIGIGTDGGLWQGTGTFSSPNTGLRIDRDNGIGRLQTYKDRELQVEINTDGQLTAGDGNVIMSADGLNLTTGESFTIEGAITWSGGTILTGNIYQTEAFNVSSMILRTTGGPGGDAFIAITKSDTGLFKQITMDAHAIGIGTQSPHESTILDINSISRAVRLPRLTATQRNDIINPQDGLILYNQDSHKFQGRANGNWVDLH